MYDGDLVRSMLGELDDLKPDDPFVALLFEHLNGYGRLSRSQIDEMERRLIMARRAVYGDQCTL